MTVRNSAILAGLLLGATLVIGAVNGAAAAPMTFSQAGAEAASSSDLVIKTVTAAGVAHRSTRRTARRVYRR